MAAHTDIIAQHPPVGHARMATRPLWQGGPVAVTIGPSSNPARHPLTAPRPNARVPALRTRTMSLADRQRQFDALARRYADDLFRFSLWLCGDRTLASDLVQETYMRAWKSLRHLKDADAAKSWLITILRREYARTFERKALPVDDVEGEDLPEKTDLAPEELAERDLLRQAIGALERKYREPLLLQVVLGLSIAEVASQLELTESAAMTRIYRAREKIKARLKPADDKDGHIHELA